MTDDFDIDHVLAEIEAQIPGSSGVILQRVIMDVAVMHKEGFRPTEEQRERGFGLVWALAVGVMQLPKTFFHAQTIRQVCLKAHSALVKHARKKR